MSFDKLAKYRRSCRQFDNSKEVSDELINKVVEAGLHAPTARNLQGVHLVVIKNKDIRDIFSKVNTEIGGAKVDMFYGAPVVILVLGNKGLFATYDGACAIENMLLEASDIGLGSCWIHRAKEEIEVDEIKEILKKHGVNADDYEGVGHVILGYPAKEVSPQEKAIKPDRVTWIK